MRARREPIGNTCARGVGRSSSASSWRSPGSSSAPSCCGSSRRPGRIGSRERSSVSRSGSGRSWSSRCHSSLARRAGSAIGGGRESTCGSMTTAWPGGPRGPFVGQMTPSPGRRSRASTRRCRRGIDHRARTAPLQHRTAGCSRGCRVGSSGSTGQPRDAGGASPGFPMSRSPSGRIATGGAASSDDGRPCGIPPPDDTGAGCGTPATAMRVQSLSRRAHRSQ